MTARTVKRVRRIRGWIYAAAVVGLIVHLILRVRGIVPRIMAFELLIWIAIMLLAVWWEESQIARLRRRAEACGYLLCDACTYDLRGVETGVCPECGEAFTAGTLKERWTDAGKAKT